MTGDLGTGELSSPAANGATGESVSALSVGSNRGAKAINALDVKAESTVLIAETNRLAQENQRLKDKLALLDVEQRLALLKETSKPFRTNEFLSSVCLIAGSAGLGAAASYLGLNTYGWYVFIGMSTMLVLAGIVARVGGLSSK
jgi:hypothetical protein